MTENIFDKLIGLDVSNRVEVKDTGRTKLSYLSWAWAWAEFKKADKNAVYEVKEFVNGEGIKLPYLYDENLGYMVFTSVTSGGITHEMWLPVMDGNNRAMKKEAYVVKTKYKEVTIAPATMMEINKTIMRCLVKNLAMFGLGLYIYAGEDIPEVHMEGTPPPANGSTYTMDEVTALVNSGAFTRAQGVKYVKDHKLQ